MVFKTMDFACLFFVTLTLDIFVSCQYASLTVVSNANYQQEKLKFGCSPAQPNSWSSVSSITLSKHTSATTSRDIVNVILQFSPILQNKTTWFSNVGNWQGRAIIIKEYAQPIAGSGIEFDIPQEQVMCSDEGTYHCRVSGLTTGNQNIDRTETKTLSFVVTPTSIDRIHVSPTTPDDDYDPGTIVTLICSGTVGRPAGDFTWCFKRPLDINFIGWPLPDDITRDNPISISQGCQYFRTSTLNYTVSADYDYYQFKCVTGFSSCSSFDGISSNITIYRYSQKVQLTLVNNSLYQNENLMFGCRPIGSWKSITSISLSKKISETTYRTVVSVISDSSEDTVQNKTIWNNATGDWQSRATVTKQFVNPIGGSGLEFVIPKEEVMCTDEGTYTCKINGVSMSGQPMEKSDTGTMIFREQPATVESIQVNSSQPDYIYDPATVVTLICNGRVRGPDDKLTWCFKRPADKTFISWPVKEDITQSNPVSQGCQYFITSTLQYNASTDYQFKCVTGSLSCSSIDDISAKITIQRYKYEASITLVSNARYQEEKLTFGCSPTGLWHTLTSIALEKNISATLTEEIVSVNLDTHGAIRNKTTWSNTVGNWRSRSTVIKQYIQPIAGSGIVFHISKEQVNCTDEGTYHCKVTGLTATGQEVQATSTGDVSFTDPTICGADRIFGMSYTCYLVLFIFQLVAKILFDYSV